MSQHHHFAFPRISDGFLSSFLYGISVFYALWSVWTGLRPPETKKSRVGNAALVIIVAICGLIATYEQSQRQAQSASKAESVRQLEREQDMKQRETAREQNESLMNQIEGMRTAISDVAKASGNPRWGQLSSFLDGWSKLIPDLAWMSLHVHTNAKAILS